MEHFSDFEMPSRLLDETYAVDIWSKFIIWYWDITEVFIVALGKIASEKEATCSNNDIKAPPEAPFTNLDYNALYLRLRYSLRYMQ